MLALCSLWGGFSSPDIGVGAHGEIPQILNSYAVRRCDARHGGIFNCISRWNIKLGQE